MNYIFNLSEEANYIGSIINTVPNATLVFQCLKDNTAITLTTDSVGNPLIPALEYVTVTLQCYLHQASTTNNILDVPPGADLETIYMEGRLISPKIYPMPIQAQGDIIAVVNGQSGRVMAHRSFSSPAAAVYGFDVSLGQKIALFVQFQQGVSSIGDPSGSQGSNGGNYTNQAQGTIYEVLPINILGQTLFTLNSIPTTPSESEVFINGVKAQYSINYTINSNTLTWLGITLQTTYLLEIYYY